MVIHDNTPLAPASPPPLGNTGGGGSALPSRPSTSPSPSPSPAYSTGLSPGGAGGGRTRSSRLMGQPASGRGSPRRWLVVWAVCGGARDVVVVVGGRGCAVVARLQRWLPLRSAARARRPDLGVARSVLSGMAGRRGLRRGDYMLLLLVARRGGVRTASLEVVRWGCKWACGVAAWIWEVWSAGTAAPGSGDAVFPLPRGGGAAVCWVVADQGLPPGSVGCGPSAWCGGLAVALAALGGAGGRVAASGAALWLSEPRCSGCGGAGINTSSTPW